MPASVPGRNDPESEEQDLDQNAYRRHSIFCVLPPYVLRAIARNGSQEQRERATQTLAGDGTFRSLRLATLPTPDPERRVRGALDPEGRKRRTIYDVSNTQNLPGSIARVEGEGPTEDVAVDEAYDGLGATYDFFFGAYGRDSIDDNGLPLDGHVHFGVDYDNAFWDGRRMVFGDGDGELFNRFTISLDIIGHELTHGVTQYESNLSYFGQPGALNEHLSDAFGSMVKQYLLNQTAEEADWLIGVGLLTKNVRGVALRSMREPGSAFDDPVLGKDPQPAHMGDFVRTFEDNGGVHINSSIPNRAFYLAATALGGHAWERAGRVWNATAIDPRLRPDTDFRRFARLTVRNAVALYGAGGDEERAVREAWDGVGLEAT